MNIKSLFNQYFVDVVKNHYVDFKGTANREQFWYFFLFMFISLFVVAFVAGLIRLPFLAILAFLAVICPYFGLATRRLRDAGFPSWAVVGLVLPVISLVVLVLLALPTKTAK